MIPTTKRMYRVQIQILLYLFKLSLPGPQPPLTVPETSELGSFKPKTKKRKRSEMFDDVDTTEDRLEAFMDKLAMWQLVSRIDDAFNPVDTKKVDKNNKDERDWVQIFAEDIVEPQYVTYKTCLKIIHNNPAKIQIQIPRSLQTSQI